MTKEILLILYNRLDSFDTASSTELKRRKSSPSRETKVSKNRFMRQVA